MKNGMGKEKHIILKNIIATVLVMAFFVGILVIFYDQLYQEKRNNIITKGEITASVAADQIDKYLTTNINSVVLSGYTLEKMIQEKRSDADIQDFLVGQSSAIRNVVVENSTGLYGYINGRFYSGTNWIPPADYDALTRPWYTKPMTNKGRITMLDPYIDVQSGNVMLAVGKTLSDGVSVISVDISLDKIQQITEEAVASGESDIEMIINDKGIVVAHSDKAEVGKDYTGETGTLGADIMEKLRTSGSDSFEIMYGKTHYIVYAADLMDDWYCISVKDATAVFNPLRLVLYLTVALAVIVMIIISIVMINSIRRQQDIQRLGKQLSATADIYISMHEINLLNDTFTEVRNVREEASEMIGETHDHCQDMIRTIMTEFSDEDFREAAVDFVDFSKLNERLKNRNTITLEWLNREDKWRRSRYIVSDRAENGNVIRALYLIEDIDSEKRERDRVYDTAQQLSFQIRSIANIYTSVHDIDLIHNSFAEINTSDPEVEKVIGDDVNNAQQVLRDAMDKLTDESSKESVMEFIEFPNIEKNVAETGTATIEFLNSRGKWCRGRFIVSEITRDGRLSHVIWAVENIDDEKRRRDRLTVAAETLNARISSIANIYMTAHELDIPNDTFFEVKSQLDVVNDIVGESRTNAQATLTKVMESITDEAYIDDVRRFIDLSTLDRRMRKVDTITIEYMNRDKLWRRGRFVVSKRDEEGKLIRVMWLSEDINNEKKERDKLLDMSERAIAASEAKTAFLSNMSHEIRTPINAVLGMNEMILRECGDSNIRSYSENIRTAGTTLLGLVNDILDFSKIEAGKMEIRPVDYDLSDVINSLITMIQTKAEDKGLKLILNISREVPKNLRGDVVRIKQVITNLLTNAVKYTEKGSVTFSLEYVKLSEEPDSIMLEAAVMDTGIGIRDEDMARLFSEFDRIEEERNRNIEGTGLGMSITKHLLDMMGANLDVESVYGVGSKFSFRLKQSVTDWEPLGDYEAAYKASVSERSRYREKFRAPEAKLLIVDDMPMNLIVFESLLKQTCVGIDTAESGDEALKLAAVNKYDIIFLDHMMPDKDGIETLKELRARDNEPNKNTPAICITANAVSGAREEYLAAGFNDYITKPVDPDRLEDVILKFLPQEKVKRQDEAAEASEADEPEFGDENGIMEALAKCGIDAEAGTRNSGSAQAYMSLLEVFNNGIDQNAGQLDDFYRDRDFKNYTIKIHAIKSSARIIGAAELGVEAQQLEAAGKAEDIGYLNSHHEGFMVKYREFKEKLSPALASCGPDKDKKEADPAVIGRALEEIRAAAEDMDCDRLDEIFEEIEEYNIPLDDMELFDKIREAYQKYEYKTILSLIKE